MTTISLHNDRTVQPITCLTTPWGAGQGSFTDKESLREVSLLPRVTQKSECFLPPLGELRVTTAPWVESKSLGFSRMSVDTHSEASSP